MRSPHPWFAFYWGLWFGAVVAALLRPDAPFFGLLVLLAFLPVEIAGVVWNTGKRDTLSEVVTWAQRNTSKHQDFARGWNALLLVIVFCVCTLLGRTFLYYSGSWFASWAIAGLVGIWLHDHWMDPVRHG